MDSRTSYSIGLSYPPDSVSRFLLVAECQDVDGILGGCVTIQCDVAGIPETDHQFAQLRQFREWPADVRIGFQHRELPRDRLAGAPRGLPVPRHQKYAATLQPERCCLRNDYSWHSGSAVFDSVPQVSSQARTSCPVRCWPVS